MSRNQFIYYQFQISIDLHESVVRTMDLSYVLLLGCWKNLGLYWTVQVNVVPVASKDTHSF